MSLIFFQIILNTDLNPAARRTISSQRVKVTPIDLDIPVHQGSYIGYSVQNHDAWTFNEAEQALVGLRPCGL